MKKTISKTIVILLLFLPGWSFGQDFNTFLSDCLEGDKDTFDTIIEKYGIKNDIYQMLLNTDESVMNNNITYRAKFLLSTENDWQSVYDKFESAIDNHPAVKEKKWEVSDDFYQGMTHSLSIKDGKKTYIIELFADYSQVEKRVTLTVFIKDYKEPAKTVVEVKKDNNTIPGQKCIEGNCKDGYSKMEFIIKGKKYYYEGNMLAGHPHGMGKLYEVDASGIRNFLYHVNYKLSYKEGVGMSQTFDKKSIKRHQEFTDKSFTNEEGRMGNDFDALMNSNSLGTIPYLIYVFENNELIRTYPRTMTYHKTNPNTSFSYDYPLNTANGSCINGNCENGNGIVSFEELGTLEAYFKKGKSEGMGILTLLSGEKKLLKLYNGIPDFTQTLALPRGASDIPLLNQKENFAFYSDDCVEGDCYNGYGTRLVMISEHFIDAKTGKHWWGIEKGNFKNGKIHGKTTISHLNKKNITVSLNYLDGVKEGEAIFKITNDKQRKLWFNKGVRVLANGDNYEEYIEKQYEKDRLAFEKKSQEESDRQEQLAKQAAFVAGNDNRTQSKVKMINRCELRAPKKLTPMTPINYIDEYPNNLELTSRKYTITVPGNVYEKKTMRFFLFQEGCTPAVCTVTAKHNGEKNIYPTTTFSTKGHTITASGLTAGKTLELEIDTDIACVVRLGITYISY